jgi:hypothetical protein
MPFKGVDVMDVKKEFVHFSFISRMQNANLRPIYNGGYGIRERIDICSFSSAPEPRL